MSRIYRRLHDGGGANQVDLNNDGRFEVYYPSNHPRDSRIEYSGYEMTANATQIDMTNSNGSGVVESLRQGVATSVGSNEDPSYPPKYENLIVLGPAIAP